MSVSTIKPAGGGDYSTLQAWEDWADGETAAPWAECYTGGNLGACTVSGWVLSHSASVYGRIYAADGERHDGDIASGAYIDGGSTLNILTIASGHHFFQLDGLRLTHTNSNRDYFVNITSCKGVIIERCLMIETNSTSGHSYGIYYAPQSGTYADATIIRNNLIIQKGTFDSADGYAITIGCGGGAGSTFTVIIVNNTIVGSVCTHYGIRSYLVSGTVTSGTVVIKNNVSADHDAVDFSLDTITNVTYTEEYNVSTDATATGTGSIASESSADLFTDPSGDDYTPKTGSALIDNGTDTSAYGVTVDMLGTTRGATYDIGAYEIAELAGNPWYYFQHQ